MNLEILVGTITGDRLVDDYVGGDPRIAPFFAGSPFDPEAYHAKAAEIRSRFDDERLSAMAAAVRPVGPAAEARLASIARGHGFMVTTGQQPGLFGGPLYTVHKALTAVALATRLEAVLGAPVLPLFWVASDDHDWEEANHVHVLDTANEIRRLVLAGDDHPPRSLGQRRLDGGAETALTEMAQGVPPSDFAPVVLERLQQAYRTGATVAGAFRALLAALFADLPLGFVDGQDPVVRRLGAGVVQRALERAAQEEAALARQTARLAAEGYDPQVTVLPGASNVFHEDDEHGRERLLWEPGQTGSPGEWVLRSSGRRLADDALWRLWSEDPGRFSPNVVLRPVVESAVFPTLAYVAGPGEVRYMAQTRPLFETNGIGMPLIFPRLSVVLVEAKVAKVLRKFNLEPSSFQKPVHEVIASVVREDVPAPVQAALAQVRDWIRTGYDQLQGAAQEVDPTLKGPVLNGRNEAFRALSEVEKKIRHHVKLKQQTDLEQIEKAAVNLAPLGKPQERVLNVNQYLARYGDGLLGAILERLEEALDRPAMEGEVPGAAAATPIPSMADER